jgi:hypothetical protein
MAIHAAIISYPRVQPVLKCAGVAFALNCILGGGAARVHHTERSLQVHGSHHIRITEIVIHHQQPESQELLPVAALAPVRTQRRGWPHTAVQQDCRKVTHTSLVTIRPPASSCQLCRGSNSMPLNPF